MTNLEICKREKEDEAAWDAYVYSSHTSTFYHQQRSVLIKLFKSLMWRNVVEKTYKHKPIYLMAKEDSVKKRKGFGEIIMKRITQQFIFKETI